MAKRNWFFGILVIVLVFAFALAGCSNSTTDDPDGKDDTVEKDDKDDNGIKQTAKLTIAGTFASQNGSGLAKFYANDVGGVRSASRAASGQDCTLEGFLEDGDIVFKLAGYYNNTTKTYSLSAASSILRYSITGTFNDNGAETGKVVVQIKTGDTWITIEITVTASGTAPDIDPNKPVVDETPGGVPENMRGIWRMPDENDFYMIINSYSIVQYDKYIGEYTFYMTDVSTKGDVTSFLIAYKGFDYNEIRKINPNYYIDMCNDYAVDKNIKYYDHNKLYRDFMMTNQILEIVNKYDDLELVYTWGFSNWDEATGNKFFNDFYSWMIDKHPDYYYNYCTVGKDRSSTQRRDLLLSYRDGDGKDACEKNGVEVRYYVDGDKTISENCLKEISSAMETWAVGQGYVTMNTVSKMLNSDRNYEEEWLTKKYPQLYYQFYEKYAMKLQGNNLLVGIYYKVVSGEKICDFKSYSEAVNLSEIEWELDGLFIR